MKSKYLVLALLLLLVAGAMPARAQFTQDPDDAGAADTMDLVFSVLPDFTTNKLKLQADLYVYNDAANVVGATIGFTWDHPNLVMDSASATPMAIAAFDLGRFFFEGNSLATTNANRRFLFGGAAIFATGVTPNPTRQKWATYYFTFTDWNDCDSIIIDTLTFSSGSTLLLAADDNTDYEPYVTERDRYKDTACAAPSNLLVSPSALVFDAIQGGPAPTAQLFAVNSDNEPLAFTLHESVSWFSLSPTLGTTPRSIQVLPNIIGLNAGTYVDSIEVRSTAAANSPQWVKITMNIEEPPPVIGYSPSAFFFNAVAGGANPDPKILAVSNTGGQTLNWTVTKSQPWLTLAPGSGADDGNVTVSVDITGLSFDNYYDTIVISDPQATNNPIRVPVTLSVGSDLPVIVVDSAFNYVVVPAAAREVGPWMLTVRNDGAGAMDFWLIENSNRLFTITPTSGSAPQSVQIDFKLTGGTAGDDYFDTLWVYSNEAINSPYPVVFQFHLVADPAQMAVSPDTVRLTLYECEMGTRGQNPAANFIIQNIGGDDPMPFIVNWESDLFELTQLTSTAPATVSLMANYLDLPLGVYLDTIVVYSYKSITPIDTVIVKYSVIAGTQTPKIWVSNFTYTIPAQENQGPLPDMQFSIRNEWGGCMPWYIVENVPWLFPEDTAGVNPASLRIGLNPDGVPFGEYPDSFIVYAPTASNSPGTIRVRLQIWRFHGDNDWDAQIDVSDLTYLVRYLFTYGPEPRPTRFVGDMDCNKFVNVSDLTYFVDYMFNEGPIPCLNPYK